MINSGRIPVPARTGISLAWTELKTGGRELEFIELFF